MTKKELLLAANLLDLASDEFSNHGCNDWNFPKDWTRAEKISFIKEYHEWNGDPEEFDESFLHIGDDSAMSVLAAKLSKLAGEMSK